jgi:hypothetical protein
MRIPKMRSLHRLLPLLPVAVFVSLCPTPVPAQSEKTLEQFTKEPHIGPAEEAIVGVEVTHTAEGTEPIVRHGNGVLLRCDGFVLAPASLFTLPPQQGNKEYTGKVSVTLSPGTEKAKRVSTTLPKRLLTTLRYTVIKLPDVHIPAVRALMPDTLEPGDTLEVVWSAWDAATRQFQPPRRQRGQLDKMEPLSAQSVGTRKITELPEGIPVGAVVLGPEALAVGILSSSQAGRFATLETLDKVTNCVTPLPLTDADFARKRTLLTDLAERELVLDENLVEEEKTPEPSPGMVAIPGGPVRLPPSVLALQRDMLPATTACVAPFLIDKYEVTNGQYLAFWKALPEKKRNDPRLRRDLFPVAWADTAPFFPDGMRDVPVLGVTYEGAKEYAKWVGKRLPTPYEWSLAAFGPTGGNVLPDWAKRFVVDRQKTWKEIVEAHLNYLNHNPPLLEQYNIALGKIRDLIRGIHVPIPNTKDPVEYEFIIPYSEAASRELILPWYFYRDNHTFAVSWSKNTVLNAVAPLFQIYKSPQHVLATGAREFDVSPYGVHDMALNAFELVCPTPEQRTGGSSTFYMRTHWTQFPPWDRADGRALQSGAIPFTTNFNFYFYHPGALRDLYLLSRRLRSTTTNAGRGTAVLPDQEPRSVLAASMYEIAYMMPPITGWEVYLAPGPTTVTPALCLMNTANNGGVGGEPNGLGWTASPTGEGPGQSPAFKFSSIRSPSRQYRSSSYMFWDEAASYPLWRGMPKYFIQEMGRPYDTDAPEGRNYRGPHTPDTLFRVTDTYLVPGGFRCVR